LGCADGAQFVSEPKHHITTRPATPRECEIIVNQARFDFVSYGCLTLFFGVVPAVGLGWLGAWIGSFISPDARAFGRYIGWALSVVLLLYALVSFTPFSRRQRKTASKDAEALIVEQIAVSTNTVFEIGLINDNEPILVFDIGSGGLLFLQGQWLREPATYGTEPLSEDPPEEIVNNLPSPYSFPSTEFVIERFPHSGLVLSIQVSGEYLAPQKTVEALKYKYEFHDSEIFTGEIENVAQVLAQAHAAQFTR
jgi:hypothetical protein